MALLRMLNRAALICNVCFLLAMGVLMFKGVVNPEISSPILVMGFFLSLFLNIIVAMGLIVLRMTRNPLSAIPGWLRWVNGIFLIIQLIVLSK